ncbi:Flp pilus assembly protein CpaB [Kineosporia babensis]|uniref:SAF domain-containing protein n=1 Tax=Kineosporia babensis TaxID=499548 RepID=A0A9X1NK64_9ACTN|nr:SAF domain-containing protein [Kineosporia babensis]MCD5315653.1 SAF domain-containing protein [Kineosporia babensis]
MPADAPDREELLSGGWVPGRFGPPASAVGSTGVVAGGDARRTGRRARRPVESASDAPQAFSLGTLLSGPASDAPVDQGDQAAEPDPARAAGTFASESTGTSSSSSAGAFIPEPTAESASRRADPIEPNPTPLEWFPPHRTAPAPGAFPAHPIATLPEPEIPLFEPNFKPQKEFSTSHDGLPHWNPPPSSSPPGRRSENTFLGKAFRRIEGSDALRQYRELRHPPRLGSGRSRTTRLTIARHRTKLTVGVLLFAIWFTVRAAGPAPPELVTVLVAAQDLPAGHRLTSEDLRTVEQNGPGQSLPGLDSVVGRVLATPVREGEPITDTRVLGPGILRGLPAESVAVPIRLSDPAGAALVRPGDRVNVLASTAASWSAEAGGGSSSLSPSSTEQAARNALVLSVYSGEEHGGVLVLAVPASEVSGLVGATTGAQVSVVVLP